MSGVEHPVIRAWMRVQELLERYGRFNAPADMDAVFIAFHEFIRREDLGDLEEQSLAQIAEAARTSGKRY